MFAVSYSKQKISGQNPVKLFEKLRVPGESSVLLQSAKDGRYSVICYQPFMLVRSKDGQNEIRQIEYTADSVEESVQMGQGDPLEILRAVLAQAKVTDVPKNFPPFVGGGVGYFSYDFGTTFEGIKQKVKDDLETPDLYFAFFDKVIVFDHIACDLYFIAIGEDKAFAKKLVAEIAEDVKTGSRVKIDIEDFFGKPSEKKSLKSNLTYEKYKKKIQKIKEYLRKGETYQVNFAQRFEIENGEDPFEIYKRLTEINPSPFACFLDFEDLSVVSCSPERLFKLEGSVLETRPIKGTVPRGKNAAEDKKLIRQLLDSLKDNAELTMIVDLARNDIGRVCKVGSVEVTEHRAIEKWSHVIHTVSNVRGILQKGKDFVDIIRAVFPGGSITGCPKKRTMEIIDELEEFRRGIYCGSAGYISFDGNADFNIMIRTMACKDGRVYFHAGGGIVVDSEAKKEYQETLNKAQAMVASVTE